MNALEAIQAAAATSDQLVHAYLGDLEDADLMRRPHAGCNHVAWQLGHLIASECQLIEIIRPGGAPELPEGFAERHGRDPEACADDDASHFPTKAEYLELYAKVREAGNAAVGSLTEADLDKPNPVEGFAKQFPTIGSVCLLNAMHPTMHVGQWVPVRREAGKPVVI